MKEIFKSKIMIGFVLVILSLVYMNSNMNVEMDENLNNSSEVKINL